MFWSLHHIGVDDDLLAGTAEIRLHKATGFPERILCCRQLSRAADPFKERQAFVSGAENQGVNLKRVTGDQAKRIVDFLSGTIYAIGGEIQKIGGGIFLCTPNNVNIQGKITDEKDGKDIHDNDDINIEW